MSDEIIVADDDWPETQTGGEESKCDEIIDASEPRAATLDEFAEDS